MKSFLSILFMIFFLLLILGANFYVFYRLWHLIPLNNLVAKILFITIAASLVLSLVISFVAGNVLPTSVVSCLYKIGSSWVFFLAYLCIIFLLCDIIRITHILPVEKYMFNSWTGFIVLTVFISTVMTIGYVQYQHKKRVELHITSQKNTENAPPLKIVALSDLHLGYSIGKQELQQWIELINKENPDLVLIAGDMIDNHYRPLKEQNMEQVLQHIHAKYGVYSVLGNHEYIAGLENSINFIQKSNITLLRDSAVLIEDKMYIVGRDDKSNHSRKSIAELIAPLDKSKPILLLDHQPYHLEEVEDNQIDFAFFGHTHRGQIWPLSWVTDLLYEKAHGCLQKGNSQIYISSGMGIWGGKFRIGTRSEYVVVYFP